MNYLTCFETKLSTAGGTLVVLLYSISGTQLLTTAIIAATGSLASFLVSVFCKWVFERIKKIKPVK
ncbi:MAG: hypothetical protein U0T68_08115 [Ferruginibacter sp.]